MEHYIEDVSSTLRGGMHVTEVSSGDAHAAGPTTVLFDPAYAAELSGNREIQMAISKRFRGKVTVYGSPAFADLLVWCLSSDGYKVGEGFFERVSDSDVELVWHFIDTMRVSSTDHCRELVGRRLHNRDSTGFKRARSGIARAPRPAPGSTRVPTSPPVAVELLGGVSPEHLTVEDVMVEDVLRCVLTSQDPAGACQKLFDRSADGNESRDQRPVHM
jgi:hypothetical protein